MNNLDPLVSTGPSQSHSPRLNRRDTINVRITGDFIELYCENLGGGSEKISANILTERFNRDLFKVLSLGEDVLPNYIMDKKIGQEDRWIILHYSPFKVNS